MLEKGMRKSWKNMKKGTKKGGEIHQKSIQKSMRKKGAKKEGHRENTKIFQHGPTTKIPHFSRVSFGGYRRKPPPQEFLKGRVRDR